MFIEFTFKVNGYTLKHSTISVTYTATDEGLNLRPHHIRQLSVDTSLLEKYAAGLSTVDELKAEMRQLIIGASTQAQHEWNSELNSRASEMPEELLPLFGVEWTSVTEVETQQGSEVVL